MKILKLSAENIKRLVAVEITPDGNVIEVTGKNGNGKTSVLDCISWALAGKRAIQWQPIRKGAAKAIIRLDLGDDKGLELRVTRRFNAQEGEDYTESLTIEAADGSRPKGQQTLLSTLVSRLTFDPLDFLKMKTDEQIDVLKALVPGVDFADIAARRQGFYDRRTGYNRDAKAAQIRADKIVVPPKTPDEPVDVSEVMEKIRVSIAASQAAAEWRNRREFADKRIANAEAEIERLKGVIAEEKANIKKLGAEPEPGGDVAALQVQVEEAQATNGAVQMKWQKAQEQAEAARNEKLAAKCTEGIIACDAEVEAAIKGAKLPVKGLTLAYIADHPDPAVMLGGVPFEQASDAEQLRASMAIGMAMNPDLRVLRIRDGSLLDHDAMEVIREVAKDNDWQFWVERVIADGPDAVVIEDGRRVK